MTGAALRQPGPTAVAGREPAERPRPRLVDATALLVVVGLMVRLARHAADPLSNADTWFHLRIGHELLGGWSLQHPGRLSSFATASWVPTQWSTEVVAAAFESRFGLPGVAWLFGALYVAFVVVVFLVCRARGDVLPAALATAAVVVAAGGALSARPQAVSLVLFAVTVGCWERAAELGRAPWGLVPMTWVWATAHGLWSAGPLLGVVVCTGLLLDRRLTPRQAGTFLAVPALSAAAACLTPVGPRLLLSQVAVGRRTGMVTEWGPTDFREPAALVAVALIGVVLVCWCRSSTVPTWVDIARVALACGWILTVTRMVPMGMLVVAPILVRTLTAGGPGARPRPGHGERAVLLGAAAACLLGLALAVPHTAAEPAGVPDRLARPLAALPDGANVLVEDYTGSWIEWRFPRLNPVVDGMFDAYPVDYLSAYQDYVAVRPGWTRFVARSRASAAVVRRGSPLSEALRTRLHWRLTGHGGSWVYLTPPVTAR